MRIASTNPRRWHLRTRRGASIDLLSVLLGLTNQLQGRTRNRADSQEGGEYTTGSRSFCIVRYVLLPRRREPVMIKTDIVIEMFRVAQQGRKHIGGQFRTAVQSGVTFNAIVQESPHTRMTPWQQGSGKRGCGKRVRFLQLLGAQKS